MISKLISRVFSKKSADERVSVSVLLGGDTPEKHRLYERALKGAAEDQKKVIADYHKKFGTP